MMKTNKVPKDRLYSCVPATCEIFYDFALVRTEI